MHTRAFLTLLAAIAFSSAIVAQDKSRPPNVLLIITDDQGYGDASCYGASDVRTPQFDALAASGVRFTRFRVNPLCAPTRASIFTGQSSLESGMWRGPSQKENV